METFILQIFKAMMKHSARDLCKVQTLIKLFRELLQSIYKR